MIYFNPTFLQFFNDLAANNTTEWFSANRKTYENEVKKPFADFVAEMINRIQHYEPEVQIKPADAISKINKDIRFSKDKTPYNTHDAANISAYGKKDKAYPGFYFQLSPAGVMIYGGTFMVENQMLQNIRMHIAGNAGNFSAAYQDKNFKKYFGEIKGEQNKRISPEFQAIAAQEPLISNKQFYYSATLNPEIITSEALPETLMEYYLAGKPVNDFLKHAFALS